MKIQLIVNPNAGPNAFQKQILAAEKHLKKLGCTVERIETQKPGDATDLARWAAGENFDVAVAVGGDGTVNEVVNGLVNSTTALGVIPAGTANVYAADVGIPIWNPLKSEAVLKGADIIASGQRRQIDLGRLTLEDGTSRYFIMWCGIGLDAAITQAKRSGTKNPRPLSYASWIISGLLVTYDFMGTSATLETDHNEIHTRMLMAVISNGQLYGRVWRMAPKAKMDDGLLDVAILKGHRWPSTIKHVVGLTFRRHIKDPDFQLYRTKHLSLHAKDTLPVHVDAETIGKTPVKIDIAPLALNIVIPNNAPTRLFEN